MRSEQGAVRELQQAGKGGRRTEVLEPYVERVIAGAINKYIEVHNGSPKPFTWTKSTDDVLAAIKRPCLGTRKAFEKQEIISKISEPGC